MYQVEIYKTPGCGYCVKIDELMYRAHLIEQVTEYVVGKDITIAEFKEKFPESKGFPHVIVDGKSVGGLIETVKWCVEKGLVTSRK